MIEIARKEQKGKRMEGGKRKNKKRDRRRKEGAYLRDRRFVIRRKQQ